MKLFAKKSLGQHFLNSKHVLGQIIDTSNLVKGETVLEIGPGTGILTEALLESGANVIAIEKDSRAIELLRTKFEVASHSGQLKVIEGDILDQTLLDRCPIVEGKYSIVANIPYYITGAILEKFLEHTPRPNRMTLLVQKEVAERIVAKEGKESILSIAVKAFGNPKIISNVPRGAFTPPPSVDSAILAINDISNRLFSEKNVDIVRFFDIVKAGFAHKRKFLQRNLEGVIDRNKLSEIWNATGLGQKVRAEDISIDEWLKIAEV